MDDKTRAAMAHIKGKYPEVKHWRHITGVSAAPGTIEWSQPHNPVMFGPIVPIPYKPPSPELMKILEQAQQLASDACMYGSAFWTVDADGSKRRVDPAAASGREVISDYTKAWEDDIMTAGNADQVGGLKNILSRTHEADKPGATQMDETDFDTGPLRGRFRADPDMRGAYGSADASNPLTAVTNMGTGVIRMTETDVFADGAALAAATDGRFVPLSDGRTLDTHGIDDGTALTSMHPLSVQGAWERCLNGSGSSADHETVMTEYRRANAAGEFDRLGEDDPARAIEDAANASDSDSLNTSWNVPISAMTRSDRVSDAAAGVDPALDIGTGNSHLGHRAMHAAAPVPLVSEAEDADWAANFVRSKAFQAQKERIAELTIERDEAKRAQMEATTALARAALSLDARVIERERALADLAAEQFAHNVHRQNAAARVAELRRDLVIARRLTVSEDAGSHDYNGPTDSDGRAVPDPVHENYHRAVGDVLAGRVMPAARRQMDDALGRAPKEPTTAPDAILRGNKAPVGIVERRT